MDILTVFACFETMVSAVSARRLAVIAQAMLTIPGRITMLSLSRWTERGGSYRTIQRFFATSVPWLQLLVKFFETHLFVRDREYILAGDETVVTKSGSQTFGLDRLFSGLRGKVVKGLGFFVFSLVDVVERKSYPLSVNQVIRSEEEKAAAKARARKRAKQKKTKKRKSRAKKKGRPKGSRNRNKKEFKPSAELARINRMLAALLKLVRRFVAINYLVMDGHFGHNQAVLMARANDLYLISKLRRDAALYEEYEGEYGGRGRRRKYGPRVNYECLSVKYLKHSNSEKEIRTDYYQGTFLHKEFGCRLNVVIIVKTNLKTQSRGHALLFSSDLELGWEKLVKYYSLRFQIEFNFRDAKQHFGLEDFMTTTEVGVENAANLSFLMVNVSAKLLKMCAGKWVGINDLKTHYRGVKYAILTLKKVVEKPEPILMKRIIEEVSRLGSIYQRKSTASTA
jgi:hypothetical protein